MSHPSPYSLLELQEDLINEIGYVVVGLSSIFVFIIQAGFALYECGISRSRNVYTVLTRTYLIFFEVCILYWATGHTFAFSPGNAVLGYKSFWFGTGLYKGDYSTWLFGLTVCATTANIIATSLVERVQFKAFFIFIFFSVVFLQPVVIHWAWYQHGWLLNELDSYKYKDFAGSGVIHIYAGVIGLMGCIILKPRISRFKDGDPYTRSPKPFRGHSKPLLFLGGTLVLCGFISLRIMAVYQGQGQERFGTGIKIIVNTLITCSFSTLTTVIVVTLVNYCGTHLCKVPTRHDWWQLLVVINSSLAGMASSAAGCDVYYPWAAAINGVVAGFVYVTWSILIRACNIDDPLDVTAVHLGCGIWGVICAPIFGSSGFIYNPGSGVFTAWNIAGGCAIVLWAGLPFLLLFSLLRLVGLLRVSFLLEAQGLDTYHDEMAYNYLTMAVRSGKGSDTSSANTAIPYDSLRSNTNRKWGQLEWNIPGCNSRQASVRQRDETNKHSTTPDATGWLHDNTILDYSTKEDKRRSRFIDPSFNISSSPCWWDDPETGRRYYGQRSQSVSCPNLNYLN